MKSINLKSGIKKIAAGLVFCLGMQVAQATWFEDVTVTCGVDGESNSFGVSWGDLNNDGYPDVYLSNHWHVPALFLNQGDGTFVDVQSQHDVAMGHVDVHGVTWGDYDNDGDQDLISAVGGFTADGGTPDTPYYNNVNGNLQIADPHASGLNYAYSGRTPVWLDENSDGLLDMLMVSRPQVNGFFTALLRQFTPGQFGDVTAKTGLDGQLAASAYLIAGPNSPERPDILFNRGDYFQWNGSQWSETTSSVLGNAGAMVDAAHADVNGDGLLDLYLVREGTRRQLVTDDFSVKLASKTVPDVPGVIDIQGAGQLSIIRNLNLSVGAFRLGASQVGVNLPSVELPIVLDPSDPDVLGEPLFTLQPALRVFIWYTPEDDYWHFRVGNSGSGKLLEMEISAQNAIQDLIINDIDVAENPPVNKLLINNGDGTYSQDNSSALRLGPTRAAILADLDNDMDVDAYVVNRNAITNLPNQLFENQGDGTFVEVANAGGAAGPLTGNGDSVSFADYDLDGFLDLFVTNGRSDLIMDPYPGPNSMYRNLGNDNNWLQIDLEGTTSIREGIGAIVELSAGGQTQVRLHDGGMHAFAQNYARLHFGLAGNDLVDMLTVRWPSGVVQQVEQVPVNQVIRIIESEPELVPGVPATLAAGADGVYLWKDTYDGPYHLRAVHAESASTTGVTVLSNRPLLDTQLLPPTGQVAWQSQDYGFEFVTDDSDGSAGVDFQMHSAASGIYAVRSGVVINPRSITVGAGQFRPSPSGWLLDTANLPAIPAFASGTDRGLFVGRNADSDGVEFRWSGGGMSHDGMLELYAESPWLVDFLEEGLEEPDSWFADVNYAKADGSVTDDSDGVNVVLRDDTRLGVMYTQDKLFQPESVNYHDAGGELGEPNAYRLPMPSPQGEPDYDATVDAHLFLWQNNTGSWSLRATSGSNRLGYAGRIVSDQAPIAVAPVDFERGDSVDFRHPLIVRFNLSVGSDPLDGLELQYPPGTSFRVYIDKAKGEISDVLRIGKQRWPVSRLPVTLAPADTLPPKARERATGQVTVFASGDDGDLESGVSWPSPRFDLRPNGTVYDMLTGLTWLADANCFGQQNWSSAVVAAAALADGQCGLSDGSVPGEWRLPNAKEQLSLLAYDETQPALPDGHPFSQVENAFYWSSTTTDGNAGRAWGTQFAGGNLERRSKKLSQHPTTENPHYVWPVKGPDGLNR